MTYVLTPTEVIEKTKSIKEISDGTAKIMEKMRSLADDLLNMKTTEYVHQVCISLSEMIDSTIARQAISAEPLMLVYNHYVSSPWRVEHLSKNELAVISVGLAELDRVTKNMDVAAKILENDMLFLDAELKAQEGQE